MNEKLIHDMMNCDGRKVNCDNCNFRENPDCRNAMASHAGALIQMQDVVIANQAATVSALTRKRDDMESMARLNGKVLGEMGEILDKLAEDLAKERHCPTCEHCAPEGVDETPEICAKCMEEGAESLWELAKRYMPKKPDNGEDDAAEDEDSDKPIRVSAEQE
jgi:hypothetical protein